jgi:hypothetical protein
MIAAIAEVVAARGAEPAVIDERGETSWEDLDDRVTRLVHALRRRGLEVGDRVVAMLGNQVELVELSLACAHGGWVLVPLNWHWVACEVAYVLDDADAAAVVVDERWRNVVADALDRWRRPPGSVPSGGGAAGGATRRRRLRGSRRGDRRGAAHGDMEDPQRGGPMFYTSGTTGNPKGVRSGLTVTAGPPEMLTLMAHSLGPTIDVPPAEAPSGCSSCADRCTTRRSGCSACSRWCAVPPSCSSSASTPPRCSSSSTATGSPTCTSSPPRCVRLLDLPDARRAAFDGSTCARSCTAPPLAHRR